MYFYRIMFVILITTAFTFGNSIASDPPVEKMVFVTAGDHYQLGVLVCNLDDDKQKETGLEEGAFILDVLEDSEAEAIGLKEGDVITKLDGVAIKDADQLNDLVGDIKEEKEVQLTVNRDKKEINLKAKLRKTDENKKFEVTLDDDNLADVDVLPMRRDFNFLFDDESGKGGFLGVTAKNISESMLSYFEVDYGVLVEEVLKDTPAEKAGLKAGDVITKINDRDVKDYDDLIRTLNFYNPGEKVTVYFSRKGSKKNVSVTLAEKEKHLPRPERMMMNGDKSMHWIDKDDNVKIRKRIRRIPEQIFEKDKSRFHIIVI